MQFNFYLPIWAIVCFAAVLLIGGFLLFSMRYRAGYEAADKQGKDAIDKLKATYAFLSPENYTKAIFEVGGEPETFIQKFHQKYQLFIASDRFLSDLFKKMNSKKYYDADGNFLDEEFLDDLTNYVCKKSETSYISGQNLLATVYLHMATDILGTNSGVDYTELLGTLYLENNKDKDDYKALFYLNYAFYSGNKNPILKAKLKKLFDNDKLFGIDKDTLEQAAEFLASNPTCLDIEINEQERQQKLQEKLNDVGFI